MTRIEKACRSKNRGVHKYKLLLLFDKETKTYKHFLYEDHMQTQRSEMTRKPQNNLKEQNTSSGWRRSG